MGACEGVLDRHGELGHKLTGPGTRKWTCWVRQQEMGRNRMSERIVSAEGPGDKLTDAAYRPSSAGTGAAASSSIMAAFTPGVTRV